MIFGYKIKDTDTIEKHREQLWNDYQTYNKVEESDKLKSYLTLKEQIESIPFQKKKDEIEGLRYKGSPEEKLLKQFSKIGNSKKITRYFDFLSSQDFARMQEIEEKQTISELEDLETYVKKGAYKAELKRFKNIQKHDKENAGRWDDTEAYEKKKRYEELKTSPEVLFYKKTLKSVLYRNYLKVKDSSLLNQYEDMKAEVNSDTFNERVAYLKDDKRFEKTVDYQFLKDYQELNSDPGIQLYMSYNDTDKFWFFREWNDTFIEQFNFINPEVWDCVTPLALKGPGKNFSIKNQLHYANKLDNFDTENSLLTLETKKEDIEGLYWDEKFGFVPKTFNYVSGVLHSMKGFNQQYGLYEVKLKASKINGVITSVSLADDEEDNCIRLFTAEGNKMYGGVVTTDHQEKKFKPVKLKFPAKGYMIISLNWTPEKLEWKVNDKHMGTITENVPHETFHLRIETEVVKDTSNLPHRLDIDWIKCYKQN
jgi:hypothetical protein